MKDEAERNVERMTFGALLVLLGIVALVRVPGWFFPLAAAAILLGSAYYQRSRGWSVGLWTWLFGGIFAVVAVLDLIGNVFGWLWDVGFPLLLIALGVLLILNIFTKQGD
jgi:hypothetical protein